jgi:hypothetical protein
VIFCFPGVAAIMRHRLAHELYRLGAPLLARIVAEIAHALAGVDIHPGAEIEEGFFIDHGTAVVIGETAVIGRNVRIYQGSRLGRSASRSVGMADFASAIFAILLEDDVRDLRRRDDSRPHHDRARLVDRRQCLADGKRAARQPHHAGQNADE